MLQTAILAVSQFRQAKQASVLELSGHFRPRKFGRASKLLWAKVAYGQRERERERERDIVCERERESETERDG